MLNRARLQDWRGVRRNYRSRRDVSRFGKWELETKSAQVPINEIVILLQRNIISRNLRRPCKTEEYFAEEEEDAIIRGSSDFRKTGFSFFFFYFATTINAELLCRFDR